MSRIGSTEHRRRSEAVLAGTLSCALALAGCTAAERNAAPAAPAPAAPAPPAPPAPAAPAPPPPAPPGDPDSTDDPDDAPSLAEVYSHLDWPFDEDTERILAFPAQLDAAFDDGAEAGLRFLAEHSWPDGFTADTLLACRLREPTPTYAELDADGFRWRFELLGPLPVPGFEYPPTGEYPADAGLRPYVTMLRVLTSRTDRETDVFETPTRFAVREDGSVTMFPTCFEYLPGEFLHHRVTDGHVGGYTDAEAEGDIRMMFGASPAPLQDEACERHTAGEVENLQLMILPYDIEGTAASIPGDLMMRVVGELCEARLR